VASQVNICNMALMRIGVRDRIASMTEGSEESRVLSEVYETILELVLTQVDWAFARQRKALTLLETMTGEEWTYRYQLPANCAFARKIEGDARNLPNEALVVWQLESQDDGLKKTIVTDRKDAVLIYTRNDLKPGMYPAHFRDHLQWMLAQEIARPLSVREEIIDMTMKAAMRSLSINGAIDLNQAQPDQNLPSEFERVREGDLSMFRVNSIRTEDID